MLQYFRAPSGSPKVSQRTRNKGSQDNDVEARGKASAQGCAGKECEEIDRVQGFQLPVIIKASCVAQNASDAEASLSEFQIVRLGED